MKKVIIFGASGDLCKRKLLPALSNINHENIEIICYSRSNIADHYKEEICKFKVYEAAFLNKISYIAGPYDDLSSLEGLVGEGDIFYFSVPPDIYGVLFESLKAFGAENVAVEKPFGKDLQNFEAIKDLIDLYGFRKVRFIDHYLLKPMTVFMAKFFECNAELIKLISSETVENMEIIFKEKIGFDGRSYFDATGLILDVVQNHMAEVLAIISAKGEKSRVDILKNVPVVTDSECILGQYDTYRNELGKTSDTETFCVVNLLIESETWRGTPFIITAGKGLDEKRCEVRITFKKKYFENVISLLKGKIDVKNNSEDSLDSLVLVLNYSPSNEIYLEAYKGKNKVLYKLHNEDDVLREIKEKFSGHSDHEIVFDSMINELDFPSADLGEVECLWRIFKPSIFTHMKPQLYKKGDVMPEFGLKHAELIKSKYRND